jgi:hypothetical protein
MANEFIARKGLIALEDSQITGSLSISSTLKIPGFNNVSASLAAAVAGGDNLGNHTATQNLNMGGNAITSVGNVDGVDVSALNSSFNTLSGKTLISSSAQIASSISGSFTAASASFSTRVTANDAKVSYTDAAVTNVINAAGIISSSAQISSDISGSFTAASASFSTRVTANDAKLTANTSNVTSAGALMDSELAEIATVKGLTKTRISGSFTAASASFSTRVTANEATSASFSTRVTANEATSASFSTRVTANDAKVSYTDAAVTSVINAAGIISSSAQFGSSDDVTFRTIEATSLTVTSITSSIVTSSIVQTEGSNIFGDASTDTHTFNGNITASGNISSSGQLFAATLSAGAVSSTLATAVITRLGNDAIPIAKLTEDAITIGGAGAITLGNSATVANILKGSTAISSSAQIATNISGAFTAASSSFSTRVTANDAKLTANTSNVTSAGALMDSELAEIATVKGLTKVRISGSFTAASASFSTRITANEATSASFSTRVTANEATSASLSSRITTNTGNIGTTTNALTVDNATLQLNSGTTFNGSAARTISIKDGGVDSDALAANIAVTQLTASIISSSGTITADSFTGNGLSIDGPQNSHIEVGTHIVGFDTAGVNNFHITGSGLIVSGAMADSNHHNMVKIGNVELVDFNNAISPNEFLIRNVQSLKITSGSDGGDVAGTNAGNLFEHNGTDFKLYRNNSAVITVDASTTTFNNTNVSFVANAFFKATVEDPGSNGHFLFTVTDPGSSPQQTKAVNVGDVFKALTGAVTASAVSASEKIITSELSAPGDLTIDADGADILLKDGGTEFGRFKRDSSNFVIKSATNNKDIVFRGVDDSSTITALTLDMSDAGKAIFTSNISASGFISASSFAGDGSGLTNVTATATIPAGTYSSSLQTLGNITSSGDISASGTIIGNEITSSKLLITKTGAASNETLISLVGSAGVEEFSVDEDGDLTCNDINVVNRDIKGNGTTRLTLGGTNLFSGDVRVNNTTATLSLRCSDSSIVKDQTMGKISLATNDGDTNDSADIKFIATEDHSNDPNSGTKIEFRADKNAGEGDETDTLMLTLNPNTGSIIESVHQNIYDTGSTALATNSAFGDIVKFGGTSTTAGGLYYLKPDGTWAFADADAAGTATSSLAVAVGTNSSTDGMCLRGFVNPFTDPGAGIGNPVYVSTTVGRIQSTAPNGTGDVVRIVGYQYGTDLVYFNPSNDFIIHA